MPRRRDIRYQVALAVALLLSGAAGCGFHPVHNGAASERLHVVLAESKVPDAVATDEVLAGAREELAKSGALASGSGFPRCEIEVLRADEASEGIAAKKDDTGREGPTGALIPESRATRVGLVARAWVLESPGADKQRDTGDVRAFETVDVAVDARAASFRESDALRAAGHRLGQRLASRILGRPAPTDE